MITKKHFKKLIEEINHKIMNGYTVCYTYTDWDHMVTGIVKNNEIRLINGTIIRRILIEYPNNSYEFNVGFTYLNSKFKYINDVEFKDKKECKPVIVQKTNPYPHDHNEVQWIVKHLRRMGFTKGWKPSHNVHMNGKFILNNIPDVQGDDFLWLCNQWSSKVYKRFRDNCIDRCRVSKDYNGEPSEEYEKIQQNGCCGFYDQQITNPKTGNSFWIGCNFGH